MDDLPDYGDYKDSLVAFIDILGFDEKTRNILNAEKFFEVGNLLYAIKKTAENLSETADLLEEFKFTAVSDSMIVTVPYQNKVSTIGLIFILHNLQYELLGTEFKTLLRGYITRGQVYHQNGLIFGPGYSNAYKGERMIGGAPRIVLDPKIVKEARIVIDSVDNLEGLDSVFKYLTEDQSDGFYFIDFLRPVGTQRELPNDQLINERNSIKNFIAESLRIFEDQYRIRAKYKWLENYFEVTEKYYR